MPETNDVISHLYYDLNDKIDSLDQRLDTIDVEAATEPKVYVALLTQTGTNAPVATVLKNTLDTTITYQYAGVGIYNLESEDDVFTVNKSFVTTGVVTDGDISSAAVFNFVFDGTNSASFATVDLSTGLPIPSNELLAKTLFKIEVYP